MNSNSYIYEVFNIAQNFPLVLITERLVSFVAFVIFCVRAGGVYHLVSLAIAGVLEKFSVTSPAIILVLYHLGTPQWGRIDRNLSTVFKLAPMRLPVYQRPKRSLDASSFPSSNVAHGDPWPKCTVKDLVRGTFEPPYLRGASVDLQANSFHWSMELL
jgi:hypothetical protein